MGQKVNPHGLRVGVIKDWDSKWYADSKNFARYLLEDKQLREFIQQIYPTAGIARILVERKGDEKTVVTIFASKPGIVIGQKGAGIVELKAKLLKKFGRNIFINVNEIRNADAEAQLVAENIADQLEKRISYRRAMKQCMGRALRSGAKGIKTEVSGRLGGAEIARREHYHEGTIPLQTLRADINYGFAEADTQYGKIGVKVWIYKGEVYQAQRNVAQPTQPEPTEGGQS